MVSVQLLLRIATKRHMVAIGDPRDRAAGLEDAYNEVYLWRETLKMEMYVTEACQTML